LIRLKLGVNIVQGLYYQYTHSRWTDCKDMRYSKRLCKCMKCTTPCYLPGGDIHQNEVQLVEKIPKLWTKQRAVVRQQDNKGSYFWTSYQILSELFQTIARHDIDMSFLSKLKNETKSRE